MVQLGHATSFSSVSLARERGTKKLPACIFESIYAILIELKWCVKRPKNVYFSGSRVSLLTGKMRSCVSKSTPSWIRHLG